MNLWAIHGTLSTVKRACDVWLCSWLMALWPFSDIWLDPALVFGCIHIRLLQLLSSKEIMFGAFLQFRKKCSFHISAKSFPKLKQTISINPNAHLDEYFGLWDKKEATQFTYFCKGHVICSFKDGFALGISTKMKIWPFESPRSENAERAPVAEPEM